MGWGRAAGGIQLFFRIARARAVGPFVPTVPLPIGYFADAFRLEPASMAAFRERAFHRLRSHLAAQSHTIRFARSEGSSPVLFVGYPVLMADTLAYVPYPWGSLEPDGPRWDGEALVQANLRQRGLVAELASIWVDRDPSNAGAMFALATSLEMAGDPAAIDTLARARALEATETGRRELAANQAWVMIKHGLSGDTTRLVDARTLADSLLLTVPRQGGASPTLMSSLAAVRGRIELASQYAAQAAYEQSGQPGLLERPCDRVGPCRSGRHGPRPLEPTRGVSPRTHRSHGSRPGCGSRAGR